MKNLSIIRNTAQRQLVLDILKKKRTHPTADEIYAEARKYDPHISCGTIYRNLNLLSDLGEIRRLSMPAGPDHFDINNKHHYHFCCRICYRVTDINFDYNEEFNKIDIGLPGYKAEYHRFVVVGICKECLETPN